MFAIYENNGYLCTVSILVQIIKMLLKMKKVKELKETKTVRPYYSNKDTNKMVKKMLAVGGSTIGQLPESERRVLIDIKTGDQLGEFLPVGSELYFVTKYEKLT